MSNIKTVLILGSAPDVLDAREWGRDGIDQIVAINNAWRVRDDWDRLLHPEDFPIERRPTRLRKAQVIHTYLDYVPAVNDFGGFVFCGGTMAFTVGYWALRALRPQLIAYFGCDMNYTQSGNTHFYGIGNPDPIRPDPTLQSLEAKSARLHLLAASQGCAIVNLSENETSRLVFPRLQHEELAEWTPADTQDYYSHILGGGVRATIGNIRRAENSLGYDAPSGKYWEELRRFDPKLLRSIDDQWLAAFSAFEARIKWAAA